MINTIVVKSLRLYHLGKETKRMIESGSWYLYTVSSHNKKIKYCVSTNGTLYFLTQRGSVVLETKTEPEGISYIHNIQVEKQKHQVISGSSLNGYQPKGN